MADTPAVSEAREQLKKAIAEYHYEHDIYGLLEQRILQVIDALIAAVRSEVRGGNFRMGYNEGLLTAIHLVEEVGGEMAETLVAGLEASKLPAAVRSEADPRVALALRPAVRGLRPLPFVVQDDVAADQQAEQQHDQPDTHEPPQ